MQRDGLNHPSGAPGSTVGRFCARSLFWRVGSGSGVRAPTRFCPRAHISAAVTDTPPPPRRAARRVRDVGRLPEMATPSRVRQDWCRRRRRAARAAVVRASGRRAACAGSAASPRWRTNQQVMSPDIQPSLARRLGRIRAAAAQVGPLGAAPRAADRPPWGSHRALQSVGGAGAALSSGVSAEGSGPVLAVGLGALSAVGTALSIAVRLDFARAALLVLVPAEVSGPKSGRARVCFVGPLARAQDLVAT